MVCPEEAGIGATPARRANAASLVIRPGCDQESRTCAAASGPTPGWSSSCGASLRVSVSISRASSRSSTVSCLDASGDERGARAASRAAPGRVGRSGRVAASLRRSCARVSGGSSLRSGSGVVTSRSRSWQSPARLAFTAPSRAAINARSASRSPLRAAVAGRFWPSTLRAARTASSASVLPPERRSRRSRPTSNTCSPVLGEEAGQTGAVGAGALDRERTPTRRVLLGKPQSIARSRRCLRPRVASNTTTPLRTSTTASACASRCGSTPIDVVQLDLQASAPTSSPGWGTTPVPVWG